MNFRGVMPQWAARIVWTVEPLVRWRWALALGLVVTVTALAWGAGTTIPERQDRLCATLGYSVPCTLPVVPGGNADVTIGVNSDLSTPDVAPLWPGWKVSTVTLTLRDRTTHERTTLQRSFAWNGGMPGYGLSQYPCVTPECVAEVQADPTYLPPSEAALVGLADVDARILFHAVDTALAEQIRLALHGPLGSIPVATRISRVKWTDGTAGVTSSVLAFRARINFLTPSE